MLAMQSVIGLIAQGPQLQLSACCFFRPATLLSDKIPEDQIAEPLFSDGNPFLNMASK
jgi:hypothetical protein